MAKRSNSGKDECKIAYDAFDHKPILGGITIDCIPEKPPYNKIDNYGLPIKERKFKPMELPEVGFHRDDKGYVLSTYFKGLSSDEEDGLLERITQYIRS